MAAEIRDLSSNVLVTLSRPWSYPATYAAEPNVAAGETIGGLVRASRRGDTRRRRRLVFLLVGPTQAGQFLDFLDVYAGGAQAFILHLDATETLESDTDRHYRLVGSPELAYVSFQKYAVTLDLIEDLG